MRVLEGTPKRRTKSLMVAFSGRSTGIARTDLKRLRGVARLAGRRGQRTVSVVGRTSNDNPSAQDVRLALRRAEAVSKALQKMGVPADKIRVVLIARPASNLADVLTGPKAKRQLRHAEIIVH